MKDINYTIAVMIYNVEKFLCACIESCIKQSGQDIEILLIDDGSTDSSGAICDNYAKKDSRINVIHQKNGGVSSARNVAIKNARGRWLILVDGDDVLTDNAIECGRKYIYDDSDLLQFDAVPFVERLNLEEWEPKGEEMLVMGNDFKDYHMQLIDRTNAKVEYPTYNMNPAWAKMWNMDFIRKHDLYYDEKVHKGEGTLFTFTASYVMRKIRFIPHVLYGYRINPTSIMHRFSPNILDEQNIQFLAYYKVIEEHKELGNEEIINALNRRGLYLIENAIHLSIAHPDCHWNDREKLAWVETLCKLPWVRQVSQYAEQTKKTNPVIKYILKCNISGIVLYCKKLRWRQIWGLKIKWILGNKIVAVYRRIRYGKAL